VTRRFAGSCRSLGRTSRPEVLGGIGRLRRLREDPAEVPRAGAGVLDRRRRQQAQDRIPGRSSRHRGHRPRRHGVNDLLVHGAEPLYFLDYIGCARLDPARIESIVAGSRTAAASAAVHSLAARPPSCRICTRRDSTTAGFAVGVAERAKIIDGSRVVPGDIVLGLASSGLPLERLQPGPAHRLRRDEARARRRAAGNGPGGRGRASRADADLRRVGAGAPPGERRPRHGSRHGRRAHRQPSRVLRKARARGSSDAPSRSHRSLATLARAEAGRRCRDVQDVQHGHWLRRRGSGGRRRRGERGRSRRPASACTLLGEIVAGERGVELRP